MDETVAVLKDILSELKDINKKLDNISGSGKHSIDDIHDWLTEFTSNGAYTMWDVIGEFGDIKKSLKNEKE